MYPLRGNPGAGLKTFLHRRPQPVGVGFQMLRFYVLFLFKLLFEFFIMENFRHTHNF